MPLGHNTDPGQAFDSDILGRDSGILLCPTCLGFVFWGFFPPQEPGLEKKSLSRNQRPRNTVRLASQVAWKCGVVG